jgi:hypothetical protein
MNAEDEAREIVKWYCTTWPGEILTLRGEENVGGRKTANDLIREISESLTKRDERIKELEAELKLQDQANDILEAKVERMREALETLAYDLELTGDSRKICEEMIPNALKDIDGLQQLAKQALEDTK